MAGLMLQPIVEATRKRVEALLPQAADLRAAAARRDPARSFSAALDQPGLQVIAEFKRRSPSAGRLGGDLDPAIRTEQYVAGGAAAISVLTEPHFFDGSLQDLEVVRATVDVPVLRKDFTLDPVQVWEARAAGADAVLLILAIVDDATAHDLLAVARDAGVDVLVEAHTVAEVQRAVELGAPMVGVNNRDLETFVTDLATAERAASALAGVAVTVAESGVSNPEGAARMAAAGYDAILVGEALVRSDDPAALVDALRRAGGVAGP